MKTLPLTVSDKNITIYMHENHSAPVVYANMHAEIGEEIIARCNSLGSRPFHLVSVTNLKWGEDLSPWASEAKMSQGDNFTGHANEYLQILTEKIIPETEKLIAKECSLYKTGAEKEDNAPDITHTPARIIAGYSMGGLFALYAPYLTDSFSGVISVSGSLWYPDFFEYVKEHEFAKAPEFIYLSIGDKESRTKNQYLCKTQEITKELQQYYLQQGINSIFELNPGNHFKDVALRMAKGISSMPFALS